MKKISLFLIMAFLYADSFNYYFFSIQENYKEYYAGSVIDRDYNSFGDLNGIGINYIRNYYYSDLYFVAEAAYGTSIYDGAYQDGTPIKSKQKDVQIYNLRAGIYSRGYILELGYRFWNRGKSNIEGDYNEQYYWPYISTGVMYKIKFSTVSIDYYLKYNYAVSPKIKVYLGNNPTLDLGDTSGIETQFGISKKINFDYSLGIFYRFSYWHINRSNSKTVLINNQSYQIFEPESETRNQYIGIYIQKSF